MIAGRTGHLLESIGNVRLCAQVKLHICVDRERVVAFPTNASPFTVRLHKPFIDPEA